MPGITVDLARLIEFVWVRFSPDEQKEIEQRIHDLAMLTLSRALDDAVTPQEASVPSGPVQIPLTPAVPLPGAVSAADVPFGGADNYRDYTYDDFAKLCEDNGVPPTAGIGHWFGKSEGVEFDKSTPELRRKVFADMQAFYASVKDSTTTPGYVSNVPPAPQAPVQRPYVQVQLDHCPSCGQAAKYVQGGVSQKTGRPYTGFYACAKRPPCTTFYNGKARDLSWTTESDWTKSFDRTHGAA